MSSKTCREAFSNRILSEAKNDPSIFVVCSDSRGSAKIADFSDQLPDQFVEVGIAEQNAIGLASGLAHVGLKPFVVGPAAFYSTRAAEQVKVDVAYSKRNVKIIGISGGISYGPLGATHHTVHDIAFMRAIPDINVIIPSDAQQMSSLTYKLVKSMTPAYVRIGRGPVKDIYPEGATFDIGQAKVIIDGSDVAIFACGQTVARALETSRILSDRGISSAVIDMFTIKPLDERCVLHYAQKCKCIVTVEEHSIYGGLGGAVAEVLSTKLPKPLLINGIPDSIIPNGTDQEVMDYIGMGPRDLSEKIYKMYLGL